MLHYNMEENHQNKKSYNNNPWWFHMESDTYTNFLKCYTDIPY
jgi:hypothetical protein